MIVLKHSGIQNTLKGYRNKKLKECMRGFVKQYLALNKVKRKKLFDYTITFVNSQR